MMRVQQQQRQVALAQVDREETRMTEEEEDELEKKNGYGRDNNGGRYHHQRQRKHREERFYHTLRSSSLAKEDTLVIGVMPCPSTGAAQVNTTPAHHGDVRSPTTSNVILQKQSRCCCCCCRKSLPSVSSSSSPIPLQVLLCICVIAIIMCLIIIDSLTTGYMMTWLTTVLNWLVQLQIWQLSFSLFALIAGGQLLAFPTTVLGPGGGYVYVTKCGWTVGLTLSTVVVFSASVTGCLLAFTVGRYCLLDWATQAFQKSPRLARLNSAIERSALKINVLLRFASVAPDGVLTYGLCVTATKTREAALGMLGGLPWIVLNGYIGGTLTSLDDLKSAMRPKGATVVGVVAVMVAGYAILRYTYRALDDAQQLNIAAEEEVSATNDDVSSNGFSLNSKSGIGQSQYHCYAADDDDSRACHSNDDDGRRGNRGGGWGGITHNRASVSNESGDDEDDRNGLLVRNGSPALRRYAHVLPSE